MESYHERQEVIDDIYTFRDLFESLLFGQSMLEGLAKDGRLRSHFFTGGKGPNVGYFAIGYPCARLCNERQAQPTALALVRLAGG